MISMSMHRVVSAEFDLFDNECEWFDITVEDRKGNKLRLEMFMDIEVKTEILASLKQQLEECV